MIDRSFNWWFFGFQDTSYDWFGQISGIETCVLGNRNRHVVYLAFSGDLAMFMSMITDPVVEFLEHGTGCGLDSCLLLHCIIYTWMTEAKHTLAQAGSDGCLYKLTNLTLIPKFKSPWIFHMNMAICTHLDASYQLTKSEMDLGIISLLLDILKTLKATLWVEATPWPAGSTFWRKPHMFGPKQSNPCQELGLSLFCGQITILFWEPTSFQTAGLGNLGELAVGISIYLLDI